MSTSHPHCLAVRGPRCCLHAARQQAKHVACRPRTKSAARLPCAALAASPATALTVPAREGAPPLIKICGLTSAADAEVAAAAGADLLGMIMWQRGRRAVSPATARAIAATAHRHGVQAVGVFVDEDAEAIASACATARLDAAQLHGDGARAAFAALPTDLPVLYVLHANAAGELQTPLPDPAGQRRPEWLLVDGLQGGSGQTVDWARLAVPAAAAARGWLLAGGLAPGNVRAALALARPAGVDVASGVAGADGLRKDPALVAAFVAAVRGPAP